MKDKADSESDALAKFQKSTTFYAERKLLESPDCAVQTTHCHLLHFSHSLDRLGRRKRDG